MLRSLRDQGRAAALVLTITLGGCSTLNYPVEPDPSGPREASAPAATDSPRPADPPVLPGRSSAPTHPDFVEPGAQTSLAWSELVRLARIDRRRGDLDSARERLEQAAAQLEALPPSNAQRRTVLGARARLAMRFLAAGEQEKADLLANRLFDEVEQQPALGGPAMVELAYHVAMTRTEAAANQGLPDPQLRLLKIALASCEEDAASQSRLNLAFEVSEAAFRAGDHALARRAIDRAVLDARTIAPGDRDQLASLEVYRTRIALAQGDLILAEAAATSANRIFDEMNAPPASRAIAEATMARVLATKGDLERASAITAGVLSRLADKPAIPPYPARLARGELARAELAAGDPTAARALFDAALALPAVDLEADRWLRSKLGAERAALDGSEP